MNRAPSGAQLLTTTQTAHLLQMTYAELRALGDDGPRAIPIGGGRTSYRRSDIDAWIDAQPADVRTVLREQVAS